VSGGRGGGGRAFKGGWKRFPSILENPLPSEWVRAFKDKGE